MEWKGRKRGGGTVEEENVVAHFISLYLLMYIYINGLLYCGVWSIGWRRGGICGVNWCWC